MKTELRCAVTDDGKREALKYVVHFVGDIHQPLHTIAEERGGNGVDVLIYMHGKTCNGTCKMTPSPTNLHAAWDVGLIQKAVWNWGAYVARLEGGWLKSPDAQVNGIDGGEPVAWALETHHVAQSIWGMTPKNGVLDDAYFESVLPLMDRQLGLAGLRLARFLNEAYASTQCQ